jgi:hypothetical protein
MKFEELFAWIAGIFVAGAILVLGLSIVPDPKGKKGFARRFAIALSFCLFWLAGFFGTEQRYGVSQDRPGAKQEDLQTKRLKEITRSKEFRKLRKVWKRLLKLLKEKRPLTRELEEWAKDARRELAGKTLGQGDIALSAKDAGRELAGKALGRGDTALLTKEKAIAQLTYLTIELAYHVRRLNGCEVDGRIIRASCYIRVIPKQRPLILEQEKLLDEAFEDGKISKEVYEKVKLTLKAFKYRGTVIGKGLSEENVILLFKLIKKINSPPQVDITKISPELRKRIEGLIEKLGDNDYKAREEATEALLEIGDFAIPLLKKVLEHKDPEVRWRARTILEELE